MYMYYTSIGFDEYDLILGLLCVLAADDVLLYMYVTLIPDDLSACQSDVKTLQNKNKKQKKTKCL